MGKRGPKPGFKLARAAAEAAAAPSSPEPTKKPRRAPAKPQAEPTESLSAQEDPVLSAGDRENPNKLTGLALRELAHRRGLAKSLLADMSDEKIRTELRYITHRQYGEEDAVA